MHLKPSGNVHHMCIVWYLYQVEEGSVRPNLLGMIILTDCWVPYLMCVRTVPLKDMGAPSFASV